LFPDFVNTGLLAGAVAVGVPVLLHLLMRQRPKPHVFPALRFVRQRQLSNTRRLRLRHLILLALRMAALALMVLALARPTMTATGLLVEREAPVAAALVFDTSPRMDYRQANRTRLEEAQEFARWLIGQLPEESQIAVLESRLDSAVFQVDRAAALDRIGRLETTPRGQSLSRVLAEAARLVGTSEIPRREVYVFTDLARVAWPEDALAERRDAVAAVTGLATYLVDVGAAEPQNFALGDVAQSGQTLARNTPLVLQADLAALGLTEETTRAVEVYLLDEVGRPQKRAEQSATLSADAPQPLAFTLAGLEVGAHQGYLQIAGQDGLAHDDRRYFACEVRAAWPVLLAAPSPAEEYAFYLREALAPEDLRKADRAWFRPDVVTLDELARKDLSGYAAVCLLDPTPLADEVWQRLFDFASAGGGVAVLLGRNAVPPEEFNREAPQALLAAQLDAQARFPEGDVHLAPDNLQHPALARFRGRQAGVPWDAFPVYRYWRLGAAADDASTIVAYSDGRPAIVERPVGRGRVLTMTTPLSDPADRNAWNTLLTGLEPWPALMLANETMFYLVGSRDAQLNYAPGQTAVLPLAPGERVTQYLLTTPPGEPVRRNLEAGATAILEGGTDWVGIYRVQAGGLGEGLDRGFAVNLPAQATDLARVEGEAVEKLLGDVPISVARDRDEFVRQRTFAQTGWELFPWLMALVAIVLGVEHVLANRFYREV
jgi:hypothetical protein